MFSPVFVCLSFVCLLYCLEKYWQWWLNFGGDWVSEPYCIGGGPCSSSAFQASVINQHWNTQQNNLIFIWIDMSSKRHVYVTYRFLSILSNLSNLWYCMHTGKFVSIFFITVKKTYISTYLFLIFMYINCLIICPHSPAFYQWSNALFCRGCCC